MKERGILMSAPMVRAILAGTKTQTRRVCKPVKHPDFGNVYEAGPLSREPTSVIERACPYGAPGDRLWVREAWRTAPAFDQIPPRDLAAGMPIRFEAHGSPQTSLWGRLRPGMFMPRWASCITLEVTEVRVERLQDISEADAIAEGCTMRRIGTGDHRTGMRDLHARDAYGVLWNEINGAGSWDANPWVWCVSFKRIAT